ncbi:methylated-DNA--[protein]-cysteine S-methyltransferase [bacterium NHP-B]|nr:methylated-DNA--[protein]-cysteine S-methyltransferase [bacterium NHP-B]
MPSSHFSLLLPSLRAWREGPVLPEGQPLKLTPSTAVYGLIRAPFGHLCVVMMGKVVVHVRPLLHGAHQGEAPALWGRRCDQAVAACGRAILEQRFEGPVFLQQTSFCLHVWHALLSIAPGTVTTYQALAAHINKPHAQRAVGYALGCNELAVLIPCHRVIRSDGHRGGYRWGGDMKAALIEYERSQACEENRHASRA